MSEGERKARPSLSPAGVENLLREGGWPCQQLQEDTWQSRFQGRSGDFTFFVRVDPKGYVAVAIVPFVKSPKLQRKAKALYQKLLELNQLVLMAKYSIDDDLDVVLSVEYPTSELDRSEFHDAINSLAYYADAHFPVVSDLCK